MAASHLEGLVEKLMGPRLAVRGAAQEIGKLVGSEPEEVFQAIRGRILQEDSFATEPKGVPGLVALVEAHPALQRRLLGLARELPVEKVGSWAAAAWGSCLTDAAVASEFQEVLRGWADQGVNRVLKTAAQGVLKMPRA